MFMFYIGVIALILGYCVYGVFVEKILQPSNKQTPAYASEDGVDFIPLPLWRVILIEFLNIAGLGPIYGAITGALFGPSAFLWIVFGNIFIGATHDYVSGMASLRNNGMSLSELVGKYLGPIPRNAMRVVSLLLMLIVIIVFTKGPTAVLVSLAQSFGTPPSWFNTTTIFYAIILYYFFAAFLPINKIIAPLYPILGGLLIFTALALLFKLIVGGYSLPSFNQGFANIHPILATNPIFPFLCVTVACGAVSGFHATQAPMMARCLKSEKQGRQAFYGAMILEGILAMIWATIPMAFFHQQAINSGADASAANISKLMMDAGAFNNPGAIVNSVSLALLGSIGGVLTVLGVVICPITTGDTCLRSMRLTIADACNVSQDTLGKRLIVLIPILITAISLNYIDFNVLWRYLAWSNQVLAVFALWMGTGYLAQTGRKKYHWITSLPASFMTAVCITYILTTKIGFNLSFSLSQNIGILIGAISIPLSHYLVEKTTAIKVPPTPKYEAI
ncbi:MAG: carbon starvation CstA family protein [Brevinema sp.]